MTQTQHIIEKYNLEITDEGGHPAWNDKCVKYTDADKKITLYIPNWRAPFVFVNEGSVDSLFLDRTTHWQIKKLDKFISKQLA